MILSYEDMNIENKRKYLEAKRTLLKQQLLNLNLSADIKMKVQEELRILTVKHIILLKS